MHCPDGNTTGPIWRVLASSDGISSWTPLKPQHSNPNPNPLASQLWCIDFLTPPTPLIFPHRLPDFLESLMPHRNWCSIHARCSKSSLKHSIFWKHHVNYIFHQRTNVLLLIRSIYGIVDIQNGMDNWPEKQSKYVITLKVYLVG